VRQWLARPNVTILPPRSSRRHSLRPLEHDGVVGNHATDVHLAAIAFEYQEDLHSTDTDFVRFLGLRWRNPLK
jgi:uncharacterized protein